MGGAGRSKRSFSIELHRLGPEMWPLYGVEGWPHIRGFVSTVLYGDAFGTKVSGRHREGGRFSGVAVKRGSTVSSLVPRPLPAFQCCMQKAGEWG